MLAGQIGAFTLILAAAIAFIQCAVPIFNLQQPKIQQITIQSARLFFLLISISIICLALAFYYHDFSLAYVARNSNLDLPWYYRLTAVWGGHEGSLLLWIWLLSFWTFLFSLSSKSLLAEFKIRVLIILAYIAFGFTLFILLTSNPFDVIEFPNSYGSVITQNFYYFPFDGDDLNPLLQDPGMILHPPLLYAGYVGLALPFAFACAGLWQGRLDRLWLKRVRPWALAAWICLTLGITLGSYWAYYELGWGGWWFWDPVENASFMPWLIGTALIHSLAVSEKRHVFRLWTVFLAMLAFTFSIIGTFLVRSGIVTSVHAFATDPERGLFIIILLCLIALPAFLLLIFQSHVLYSPGRHRLFSKESALIINNYLLVIACAVVFLGTIYPLILDVLNLGKISVGAPYFNRFMVPLAIAMLFVMGIGPLLRWQRDQLYRLRCFLLFQIIFAALAAIILNKFVFPEIKISALLAGFALGFAFAAILLDYFERIYHRGIKGLLARASINGMACAHFGLIVAIFGITSAGLFSDSRDLSFTLGKSINSHGYSITLTGLSAEDDTNYSATVGQFSIINETSQQQYYLTPQKRFYHSNHAMPITESARLIRPTHDLYLALGEKLKAETWAVRVQYKPFIIWIWIGGLLIALGGLIAIFDRNYWRRK